MPFCPEYTECHCRDFRHSTADHKCISFINYVDQNPYNTRDNLVHLLYIDQVKRSLHNSSYLNQHEHCYELVKPHYCLRAGVEFLD